MGFTEDSMHSYIVRDLKRKFPTSNGWKIERNADWDGVTFDYHVQRREFGKMSRYVIDVLIEKKVTEKQVKMLQKKVSDLAKQGVNMEGFILMVPTDADVTLVPDEFTIMYLKILKVADNDILWWRKTPLHS